MKQHSDPTPQQQKEALQYRLFYEYSPTMYFTVAQNGTIVSVNKFGAAELGYEVDELVGTDVLEVFYPEDKSDVIKSLDAVVLSESKQAHWEFRKVHKKGHIIWVREDVNVIQDEHGDLLFLVVCQNINEEKNTARQLEEKALKLAQANADLEQIAQAASHDLKQPLRVVMGAIQLLSKRYSDKISPDDAEFLQLGEAGIRKMQQLVEDLLLYTEVCTSQVALKPCSLGEIVQEALHELRPEITRLNARFQVGPLPTVRGNARFLRSMFKHLFENALKFRNGNSPEILVSSEATLDGHRIDIQDNGIGLDPEYARYVFGVFKRLHNDSKFDGTGIGLAFCQKVVELHNGHIWLNSSLGNGTTVSFEL